jgi:hypothetical protein
MGLREGRAEHPLGVFGALFLIPAIRLSMGRASRPDCATVPDVQIG